MYGLDNTSLSKQVNDLMVRLMCILDAKYEKSDLPKFVSEIDTINEVQKKNFETIKEIQAPI